MVESASTISVSCRSAGASRNRECLDIQSCDFLERPFRALEGQVAQACDEASGACFREFLQPVLHLCTVAANSAHDRDIQFREIPTDRGALALEVIEARLQLRGVERNR